MSDEFEAMCAVWDAEEQREHERQAALDATSPRIGYVCKKGHFVFYGDPDDSCRSKAVGWLRVQWRADDGEWPEGVLAESVEDLMTLRKKES